MKRFTLHTSSRLIGIMLLGICVVFSIVLILFINEMERSGAMECPCIPGSCPVERSLPIMYVGFTAVFVLGVIAVFMLMPKQTEKMKKTREWKRVLSSLKGDERKVYQAIVDSGGAILQSELVEKTNLSKVKVSRTLDKLEVKDLVERRRRGMGNIVVLK